MNRHRRSHSPSPSARLRQPSPHRLVKLAVVEILQRFRQVARQRQAWLAIALMSATPRDRSVARPIRPNRHRRPGQAGRCTGTASRSKDPGSYRTPDPRAHRRKTSSAIMLNGIAHATVPQRMGDRSPASHRKASVTRRLLRPRFGGGHRGVFRNWWRVNQRQNATHSYGKLGRVPGRGVGVVGASVSCG